MLEVVRAFVELSRQLRVLRDLPLEVSTVQGAAAVFTHTEVLNVIVIIVSLSMWQQLDGFIFTSPYMTTA